MKVILSNGIISKNDEKAVLVGLVGIFEALKNDCVSIDETEKFIFSPRTFEKLKIAKCNRKIVKIVEEGCEIENIASLLPEQFLTILDELEQKTLELLKDYPSFEKNHWIDW